MRPGHASVGLEPVIPDPVIAMLHVVEIVLLPANPDESTTTIMKVGVGVKVAVVGVPVMVPFEFSISPAGRDPTIEKV